MEKHTCFLCSKLINLIDASYFNIARPTGRAPFVFDLKEVEYLASQNKTNLALAAALEINRNTLTRHLKNKEFRAAVENGRNQSFKIPFVPRQPKQTVEKRAPNQPKQPRDSKIQNAYIRNRIESWLERNDRLLARTFKRLDSKTQIRVTAGIVSHIRACKKNGHGADRDAIREMLDDARRGTFIFEEN